MEVNFETALVYSPSAILNLFNNAIVLKETKKLIQVKGIFVSGKGTSYSGYFYDSLKDEASDSQITLIVPALIRNQLIANKTITFNGYITKRVVNLGGRIELQITITNLVEQTHNKYSEEELKVIEIQQKKALIGYRDVPGFIKMKIINEQPINIAIIVGKTGIIDSDIKHVLKEAISFYNIDFVKINLFSETEILSAIQQLNNPATHIIVVSRGGGENLEIFNKLKLAEECINLKPYFVTAIGHKEDNTLLQKVADKAFITPSELGQFLNEIYNQTKEELQNSKAKLVNDITTQLKANYEKQIQNLNEKLKSVEELKNKSTTDLQKVYEEKVTGLNNQIELISKNYKEQLQKTEQLQSEKLSVLQEQIKSVTQQNNSKDDLLNSYKKQLNSLESKPSINWVVIIIAVIIGLVIGLALKH